MLTFFFLSQIHLLRISFCQNCMSMSQTKNCKLQPCPLGSAQQEIIACFVSKCYPSQLVVIKSSQPQVIIIFKIFCIFKVFFFRLLSDAAKSKNLGGGAGSNAAAPFDPPKSGGVGSCPTPPSDMPVKLPIFGRILVSWKSV